MYIHPKPKLDIFLLKIHIERPQPNIITVHWFWFFPLNNKLYCLFFSKSFPTTFPIKETKELFFIFLLDNQILQKPKKYQALSVFFSLRKQPRFFFFQAKQNKKPLNNQLKGFFFPIGSTTNHKLLEEFFPVQSTTSRGVKICLKFVRKLSPCYRKPRTRKAIVWTFQAT